MRHQKYFIKWQNKISNNIIQLNIYQWLKNVPWIYRSPTVWRRCARNEGRSTFDLSSCVLAVWRFSYGKRRDVCISSVLPNVATNKGNWLFKKINFRQGIDWKAVALVPRDEWRRRLPSWEGNEGNALWSHLCLQKSMLASPASS